jgi:hypothetical protein
VHRPLDELLEKTYTVDRLLARRPASGGSFEYLVAWEDYGTEGNTWEREENIIDKTLVPKFDAEYDLRVHLLWRRLRNFFYQFLCEGKEAEYEKIYTFDSTIDPAAALGLLKLLARQRGGAKPLPVVSQVVGKFRRTQLAVTDMQTVSDIVASRPPAGRSRRRRACPLLLSECMRRVNVGVNSVHGLYRLSGDGRAVGVILRFWCRACRLHRLYTVI